MKKLLLAVAVLVPTILFAQSPLDGTWKTMYDQSKISQKPIRVSLSNGIYDHLTVVPPIHVKADGQDQAVSGHPYDTIAVKELDAHTLQIVYKKNGKTAMETTRTASDDGKTLTQKNTFHPPDSDQTATSEATWERVGKSPSGAHATSGSWRIQKLSASENELLHTYKRSGDELTYCDPTGETWTAKLDGKDYPVKGTIGTYSVSLKQINDRNIEQSTKREGKLIGIDKMTISPDGRKMTTVSEDKLAGHVSTLVAEKQ